MTRYYYNIPYNRMFLQDEKLMGPITQHFQELNDGKYGCILKWLKSSRWVYYRTTIPSHEKNVEIL